jgi:hypothetical protein
VFSYLLAALVPAGALLVATAGGASASGGTVASGTARLAIEKPVASEHPVSRTAAALPPTSSTNWGGYVDIGTYFSKVSASWIEPSATCDGTTTTATVFGVGLGGYYTDTSEQVGTGIECYAGQVISYAWWSMWPSLGYQGWLNEAPLPAGATVTASVTRFNTSYTLAISWSVGGAPANSYTITRTCADCDASTAEWITQPPGGLSSQPLTQFSPWTVTGASATEGSTTGGISRFFDFRTTLVNGSAAVLVQPGALNSTGDRFTNTWIMSS